MTHLTDNYLKKIFKIIYNYIVGSDPNFDISDLFDDSNVYEDIYMFIQDKLSHTDSDEVDFIYASFSRNWEMYGSSFPEIYGEVIKPELKMYEGVRNYGATVVYNEYYHHNTYLPVMLEYMINEYQIDEDNVETDIRDTWDHQININEKK
jgi:hypothetical protein